MAILNKTKLQNMFYKLFGRFYRKKLNCTDFTIISNNCFGGNFYRQNSMQYLTPTCGLFFIASEYIKFIYDLDKYINGNLEKMTIEDSKYKNYLKMIKYDGVMGKIEDLEICFLHYKSFEEAKEKWDRRKKRINKEKIIYKFNDQNLCDYELLKKFNDFSADNKICFTAKKYEDLDTIQLKQYRKQNFVLNDSYRRDYKHCFNIYKYLNNCFK